MRWRGVHHCERCGQPQLRDRLLDAARSLRLYARQAADASSAVERARWARAMAQQEQVVREELDRASVERARLLAPVVAEERTRPREWQPIRLEAAPPPPEFYALAEALRGRRRLTPAPADGERGELPAALRPLFELARRW